jgi:hypothetical protein
LEKKIGLNRSTGKPPVLVNLPNNHRYDKTTDEIRQSADGYVVYGSVLIYDPERWPDGPPFLDGNEQ